MDTIDRAKALPTREAPMIEPELMRQIFQFTRLGWGKKRIAHELGISRNTVRRYLREGQEPPSQTRPNARCLNDEQRALAQEFFLGPAQGNAVVVRRLLQERGIEISIRALQRVVAPKRRELQRSQLATVRFETAPGHQMQIDFGQKQVRIGGMLIKVHLFVALLSYSRRIYVRAFLSQKQDDWKEAIVGAFHHFGGTTQTILLDNDGALVIGRDRETQTVKLHPSFESFCKDWDIIPRVCSPYRARTKGKTESGVKYVKRNGLAGLEFDLFHSMEEYLQEWILKVDERIHGTTFEIPRKRFEEKEQSQLRPLPEMKFQTRNRRIVRKVATDCLVDVNTIKYSVPSKYIKEQVEVLVLENEILIFHENKEIAKHYRSKEPHSKVIEPSHYKGLWRKEQEVSEAEVGSGSLASVGRSLAEYAAIIEGGTT